MGTIVKPNTFTGQTAPQLPWLDADIDTLYTLVNGNIEDANVKANAAIAESKIFNLVTDLAARLLKAGDTMTGELIIKMGEADLRLIATTVGGKDWRIIAPSTGDIVIQENTGTEAVPVWTTRYTLPDGAGGPATGTDLTTKTYVDGLHTWLVNGAAPATPLANTLYRDLIVKGWLETSGAGAWTIDADVNVASITDIGVGNFRINWATAFANANYAVVGSGGLVSGQPLYLREDPATPKTASAVTLTVTGTTGVPADPDVGVSVMAIGTQ